MFDQKTSKPCNYQHRQRPVTSSKDFHSEIAKAKIGGAKTSDLAKIVSDYETSKNACRCPGKRNTSGEKLINCTCGFYRNHQQ